MAATRPDIPDRAGAAAARSAQPVRMFGRLQLLRLLGKSDRSMCWRVADPRSGQELLLVMPRLQPADVAALEHWQQQMRQAGRLIHPNLAPVIEVGVQDGWPYVAYDAGDAAPLSERLGVKGLPGTEAAGLIVQALHGLAYGHEAGLAHHDLQPFNVLVSDTGTVRVAGMAVACTMAAAESMANGQSTTDPAALRLQRVAAERDLLACGLLLHAALCGQGPLEENDLGRVIARMPPLGREIVRLPWTTAHPVPEPLRIIVNRATDRQERQRYRNARTLLRAMEGWLQTESATGGGPLALLQDKLRAAGVLPSSPGAAARAARLTTMERERTNELAEVVLQDMALAFELLRQVNSAQVRGAQADGGTVVLTLRRAIAMIGMDGVRRAALALRPWPGPLNDAGAAELERHFERDRHVGRVALALRPAGYDAEVVYLIALLQGLGRLVVQYHFAEEAQQIRRLMQPGPPAREGEPEDPGMTEEAASFAVLGADTEAIGAAVARYWGLDDSVLVMARRLPVATPVRSADDDDMLIRTVASCAHEAVDAMAMPAARVLPALQRVVQRYGRVLELTLKDLQSALQDSPQRSPHRPDPEPAPESANGRSAASEPPPTGRPRPGGLRAAATASAAAGSAAASAVTADTAAEALRAERR